MLTSFDMPVRVKIDLYFAAVKGKYLLRECDFKNLEERVSYL